MTIWEHIIDFWMTSIWLRIIVGSILIIGLVILFNAIKVFLARLLISILSIVGGTIVIGIPAGIIVLLWGEDVYNGLSAGGYKSILCWVIAILFVLVVVTLLVMIIISSFTDKGRMGYMKGVANNYDRIQRYNAQERANQEYYRELYEQKYPGIIKAIRTNDFSEVKNGRYISREELNSIKEKANL